jgi:hypothetical protein
VDMARFMIADEPFDDVAASSDTPHAIWSRSA